jgi:putative transposase
MRLIDEHYLRAPFYGYPKMTLELRRQGYRVNRKRVARLMQKMGLQAVVPYQKLSQPTPGHRIYPYLLQGLAITRPDQVWSTDITYIPMVNGFMYLVAIIDWYSRYVIAWQLSNTLDGTFCLDTLNVALAQGQPEIFNTDQVHNLQHRLSDVCQMLAFVSVWMGVDAHSTISLSNAYGARSSMKIFISKIMKQCQH